MPKKKKVCFVVSSLVNEGPVKVMLNIIKYIDYSRFEISVVTLKEEGSESLISDFEDLPIRIVKLNIKSKISNIPLLFLRLRCVLKSINPDIVHSHCPRSLFLVFIINGKFKKYHTVHNFPGQVDRALYGNVKGAIVENIMKFTLKRIDKPISCGHNLQGLMQEKLRIPTIAINNGVDFEVFVNSDDKRLKMKESLGLLGSRKCFVFVGRFSKEKNPLFLVDAFSSGELKDFDLLMVGDGPLLAEAKNRASSNIKIVGFRRNVRDYLIASDFFVSSSITEGMPNSVLEAMSVGLPLLLSDIPSHREIFSYNSNDIPLGFLYQENSIKDFEQKLKLLVEHAGDSEFSDVVAGCFDRCFTARRMSLKYQKAYTAS